MRGPTNEMEAPARYSISATHRSLIEIIYPQTSHFFTTPKPGNFGNFHDYLLRRFPELHSVRSSAKQIKEQVSWPCWVQQVFFRARTENPNKSEYEWAINEQERWNPLQKQSVQIILDTYPLSTPNHNPPEYNSLQGQRTPAQSAKSQDSTQDAIIHRVESGRVVKRVTGERQSIPKIKQEKKEGEEEGNDEDDGENILANIPPFSRTNTHSSTRTRTRTHTRPRPSPHPHSRHTRPITRPSPTSNSTATHTRNLRLPRLAPFTHPRPRPSREQHFLTHLDTLQTHLHTSDTFLTTLGKSADQREKHLKHELRNIERQKLEIVEQRRRFVNLECEVLRVKERFREIYSPLVDGDGHGYEEDGSETEEDLFESDEEQGGELGNEIVERRRSIRLVGRDREPEDGDETEKDEDYDYESDDDGYDDSDDVYHYDDDDDDDDDHDNNNRNNNNHASQRSTIPPAPPPIPRNIVVADFF